MAKPKKQQQNRVKDYFSGQLKAVQFISIIVTAALTAIITAFVSNWLGTRPDYIPVRILTDEQREVAATRYAMVELTVTLDDDHDVNTLRTLAQNHDARSQYLLGLHYYAGHGGVPQSTGMAILWMRSAAYGRYPDAMYWMAIMYEFGRPGLPQDYEQAVRWLRRAARYGNLWARIWISTFYLHGIGVDINYHQARFWLDLSLYNYDDFDENMLEIATEVERALFNRGH